MNDAHLHLVVNHLPIVGVLIGFLVLLAGFFVNNIYIKNTALGIFIFSAIASLAANFTGENAEEFIEDLPGVSEVLIHEHEESAELFLVMMLVLGGISFVTLLLQYKKSTFSNYGFVLALLLSAACLFVSKNVGTSGGEIMHKEIRSDDNSTNTESKTKDTDYDDD